MLTLGVSKVPPSAIRVERRPSDICKLERGNAEDNMREQVLQSRVAMNPVHLRHQRNIMITMNITSSPHSLPKNQERHEHARTDGLAVSPQIIP